MIFKQDNPVSVTNTGIKGGPVIKIHIKMAIKIQKKVGGGDGKKFKNR